MKSEILGEIVVDELCSAGVASFLYTGPRPTDQLSNLLVEIMFYPTYPTKPENAIDREDLCENLQTAISNMFKSTCDGIPNIEYSVGSGVTGPVFRVERSLSELCNNFDVDVTVTAN